MKDFALRHPWITFFLVDAAVCNVCKLVNNALILLGKKGVKQDESSGDIQQTA